ncbi:MAG: isochorismate synthase [Ignavibacteriaceae bacterium]|nr:isochorismate synthase [Ignavibacteriaceae bacterium]
MKLSLDKLIRLWRTSYEIFLNKTCQEIKSTKKQSQLLSFCFALPDTFFTDDFSPLFTDFPEVFYFSANKEEFLAVGNIHSLSVEGSFRWKELEKRYTDFPEPLMNSSEPIFISSPLFLAAIKFDPEKKSVEWSNFKNCEFYIPKFLIKLEADSALFRFNVLFDDTFSIENSVLEFSTLLSTIFQNDGNNKIDEKINYKGNVNSFDERELWNLIVEKALSEIRNSSLTKVVLARRILLRTQELVHYEVLPGRLKKANPSSNIFCLKQNDSVFIGASPEILIELKNNNIITEAIAGSCVRGSTTDEDFHLENELRNSEKEINEHRSVVDFITENLTGSASDITYEKVPNVKKLASIQHLSTEITAKLKTGSSLFSLLDKISPTPAVCGSPKEKALELISELEDFDRGLYAGLIGWVSPSSAKLVVAIRSALINKNTIFVYAGCGIVEGSNPESEFAETETKLKTILSTFNEKN